MDFGFHCFSPRGIGDVHGTLPARPPHRCSNCTTLHPDDLHALCSFLPPASWRRSEKPHNQVYIFPRRSQANFPPPKNQGARGRPAQDPSPPGLRPLTQDLRHLDADFVREKSPFPPPHLCGYRPRVSATGLSAQVKRQSWIA